jgi:hypothetical protein
MRPPDANKIRGSSRIQGNDRCVGVGFQKCFCPPFGDRVSALSKLGEVGTTSPQPAGRRSPRASLLSRSTCPGLITVRRDPRLSGPWPCTFLVDNTGKSIQNAKSLQDDTLLVVSLAVASTTSAPDTPIFLGSFPCSQIFPKSPRKREIQTPPDPTLRNPGIIPRYVYFRDGSSAYERRSRPRS